MSATSVLSSTSEFSAMAYCIRVNSPAWGAKEVEAGREAVEVMEVMEVQAKEAEEEWGWSCDRKWGISFE